MPHVIRCADECRARDRRADGYRRRIPPMNAGPQSSLSGEIRDGRHVLAVRVYYEDTDFSGVVYGSGGKAQRIPMPLRIAMQAHRAKGERRSSNRTLTKINAG